VAVGGLIATVKEGDSIAINGGMYDEGLMG
jgi:hypothetical protein